MAVNVKDFGANGDGAGDDTAAMQSAIATGLDVYIPDGRYRVGPLTINNPWQSIFGDGHNSRLVFVPTADDQVCLHFGDGLSTRTGLGIRNITLASSSLDNGWKKTAIKISDVSEFFLSNVNILPWANVGSIGVHTEGREAVTFQHLRITADRPVVIGQQLNQSPTITSMDHTVFRDLYTISPVGTLFPSIDILDVQTQAITFEGYQAWVRGNGGLRWAPPSKAGVSYGLTIRNMRTEQMQGARPTLEIIMPPAARLNNLLVSSSTFGLTVPAAQLEGVRSAIFDACAKGGTAGGINKDGDNQTSPLEQLDTRGLVGTWTPGRVS